MEMRVLICVGVIFVWFGVVGVGVVVGVGWIIGCGGCGVDCDEDGCLVVFLVGRIVLDCWLICVFLGFGIVGFWIMIFLFLGIFVLLRKGIFVFWIISLL